jgi:hypothetical protein
VLARLGPASALDPAGAGEVAVVQAGAEMRMTVTASGVDDLGGGDYLEVWLLEPATGRMVAIGALARDGARYLGTFTVPAGLPVDAFAVVDVSAERWDGDPTHSRRSILRGPLTP